MLMYFMLLKGCAYTSVQFVRLCLSTLEELLRYRLAVILASDDCNSMASVYSYMDEWLGILVPNVLMLATSNVSHNIDSDQQYN